MYNLELNNNKWYAYVDWGDNFTPLFEIKEDGVPVDLTGQEIVLGIKSGQTVMLEVSGSVSGNEVTFDITHSNMYISGLKEGETYSFDFWNKTNRYTYIKEGRFKVDTVSHEVED